jgi:hypothetical protein
MTGGGSFGRVPGEDPVLKLGSSFKFPFWLCLVSNGFSISFDGVPTVTLIADENLMGLMSDDSTRFEATVVAVAALRGFLTLSFVN